MLKNPLLTFNVNMVVCSIIEYVTSWYIEVTQGTRYWDYTGIFMNLNGRICLECALFFGFGSCICVYFVAPFLEKMFQKLTNKVKITICLILTMLFTADSIYAHKYPHTGEGINRTKFINNTKLKMEEKMTKETSDKLNMDKRKIKLHRFKFRRNTRIFKKK